MDRLTPPPAGTAPAERGASAPAPDRGRAAAGMALFALVAFAPALLPRLMPLLHGTVFTDDFVHVPRGHLESYRFLNWGELTFWRWLFGPAYLKTIAPKIIGAIYTALLCVLLRAFLLRARLPGWPALLVPLHPLWNVFIAWNVCTVYILSLVLIVGGYLLLMRNRTTFGVLLIALGISGYQVHAGLLPALWLADWSTSRVAAQPWSPRRVAWSSAGVLIYLAATRVAAWAGLETWGERGMTFTELQWRAAIDNLAVLTQPLLSFYGGVELAWRFWWIPFVLLAIAALLMRKPVVLLAAPLLAALVVLPLNVNASGPRVTAAIWIALIIALAPMLQRGKIAAAVLALLLLPITLADARNRVIAWEVDRQAIASIGARMGAPRGTEIIISRGGIAPDKGRLIVMQNFEPVTPRDYSNLVQSPEWFFTDAGYRVSKGDDAIRLPRVDGETPFGSWMYDGARVYVVVSR